MVTDLDIYYMPTCISESMYKDKGSKHFGYVFPVSSQEEIQNQLISLRKKHYSAQHVCYAWSLGLTEITTKSTDDGEPSHTAGTPILGQIRSHKLHNVLIAVVRYFGGTKLGTSGLIHAYKTAAKDAILENTIGTFYHQKSLTISFPYPLMHVVMQFVKRKGVTVKAQNFTTTCTIDICIREKYYVQYIEFLNALHQVSIHASQ